MTFNLLFILNSILFGIGLAMDAFSVSVANGLRNPHMHTSRRMIIAGTFGCFQTVMPLLGWFCVHSIAEAFQAFQPYIPWIALVLLAFIGGKMIWEGLHDQSEAESLQGGALFIQGIATSIDALSVGFTIAEYELIFAVTESLIIGIVTFGLCLAGLLLGGRIGSRISGKAGIVGGIILILIGTEIFVTGII
ncbi:MAG: manganese efflux pump [Firmicutes bacterium]|jgi:Predicted membrane protein|nr:manganese efflux pump [Bacillota bacterium]MBR2830119.1 manganese efflux pump [Solobacterium sp.]